MTTATTATTATRAAVRTTTARARRQTRAMGRRVAARAVGMGETRTTGRRTARAGTTTTTTTTTTTRAVAARERSATRARGTTTVVARGYAGGGFNIVPVPDRVVALVPYLLPLLSALRYGRFFFGQFPAAVVLLKPLMPILRGVAMLPMGNLIMFFAIYLGIAKNQNLSRFCRFNGMQAILLDIALIFPSLLEALFGPGILGIGLPGIVTMIMHNAIFVVTLAAFAFAAVGCMSGQYIRFPILAEAAEAQMGY
jgi:uncharacterized membrane protein